MAIKAEEKAQKILLSRPQIQIANYKKAKEFAKATTICGEKLTQTRRPWSDRESETLVKLIERYRARWKELKDRDVEDVLEARDHVLKN